jgi:hypothetical protein
VPASMQAQPHQAQPQPAMISQPTHHAPVEMVNPHADLDLPAFMRRRMR